MQSLNHFSLLVITFNSTDFSLRSSRFSRVQVYDNLYLRLDLIKKIPFILPTKHFPPPPNITNAGQSRFPLPQVSKLVGHYTLAVTDFRNSSCQCSVIY
jgi:hypothetical protein